MSAFASISSYPAPRRAASRETATRGKQAHSGKTHTEGILKAQQSFNSVMTLTPNDRPRRDDPAELYRGHRMMMISKDWVREAHLSLAGQELVPAHPLSPCSKPSEPSQTNAPDPGHFSLPTYAPALGRTSKARERLRPPSRANCAEALSKVQRLPSPPPSHKGPAPASCPGSQPRPANCSNTAGKTTGSPSASSAHTERSPGSPGSCSAAAQQASHPAQGYF